MSAFADPAWKTAQTAACVVQRRPLDRSTLRRAQIFSLAPPLARVLAARIKREDIEVERFLWPTLDCLEIGPAIAQGVEAAHRLAAALLGKERIIIHTSADLQGIIAYLLCEQLLIGALRYPPGRYQWIARDELGYELALQLIGSHAPPTLVLTTARCNGASAMIALHTAGVDVITVNAADSLVCAPEVTYANITQRNGTVGEGAFSSTLVLWCLLREARHALISRGHDIPPQPDPHAALDWVMCAVLSEQASLAQIANRAAVRYGLLSMSAFERPCWIALRRRSYSHCTSLALARLAVERLAPLCQDYPSLVLQFLQATNAGTAAICLALLEDSTASVRERQARRVPVFHRISPLNTRTGETTVVWSDGELHPEEFNSDTAQALSLLEPTGVGFEPARFDGEFRVLSLCPIGGTPHFYMTVVGQGNTLPAVWLNARLPGEPLPAEVGCQAHFLFRLAAGHQGIARSVWLQIEGRIR